MPEEGKESSVFAALKAEKEGRLSSRTVFSLGLDKNFVGKIGFGFCDHCCRKNGR